tara:strand:+ start:1210 stop:1914 length:705 start_codon:yes stop_codon:yes gene_type:complete
MKKNNFNFNLIASDTPRTRAYIDQMIKNELLPKKIILLNKNSIAEKLKFRANPYFDNETELTKKIMKLKKIKIDRVNANTVNDIKCLKKITNSKESFFVFCSNPGEILRKEYFTKKKIYLHVHPGKLPDFKGSTPYYYEILKSKRVTFTSLFMSYKLDEGKVLLSKSYNTNQLKYYDRTLLDDILDPYFRSLTLIETLKKTKLKKIRALEKNSKHYLNYFVIHPVLKNIAIFKK